MVWYGLVWYGMVLNVLTQYPLPRMQALELIGTASNEQSVSGLKPDLSIPPYVLYGVKCIDLVPLGVLSGDRCRRPRPRADRVGTAIDTLRVSTIQGQWHMRHAACGVWLLGTCARIYTSTAKNRYRPKLKQPKKQTNIPSNVRLDNEY